MITNFFELILNNSIEIVTFVWLVVSGVRAYQRRPGKTSQGGVFFPKANQHLLEPLLPRPAYSDRMAYLLAEMSAFAYFKFEGSSDGAIYESTEKISQQLKKIDNHSNQNVFEILKELQDKLLTNPIDSREMLAQILDAADFKLLGTFNAKTTNTQGFACKRIKKGESPYLVIAFRGTEMELDDWLTDLDVNPADHPDGDGIKVHEGFWEAVHSELEGKKKNVLEYIREICESDDGKDGDLRLPCYFTGHSLGGALALITTREIAADINGACYTYGAPRVANSKFFEKVKTPVYRIVNSSDIVPRVPPGAMGGLMLKIIQGLIWLSQFIPIPAMIKEILEKLEGEVDKLKDYRHWGDLRYLTDSKRENYEDVRVLSNPPMIDRIWWMQQHIRKSLKEPVTSHGMAIYRNKLLRIAKDT